MKFRSDESARDDIDLNLTPLIDIVFLLLIFFMVSTTFKQEFEVGIDLPDASSEQRLVEKTLEITIDAKGKFFVNNQALINVKRDTLRRALQKAAGDDRKMPVIISADANTPHQAVIQAMDVAQKLGFTRLTFATQQLAQP